MKVSGITYKDVAKQLRIDNADDFKDEINSYIASAKAYVKGYTNLSKEEIDKHEDITQAVFVLISDMFENHLYHQIGTGNDVKTNKMVDTILSMYAVSQI